MMMMSCNHHQSDKEHQADRVVLGGAVGANKLLRVRVPAVGHLAYLCQQMCLYCRLRSFLDARVFPVRAHLQTQRQGEP